jgi:A/G-specific adenine glycosylase
MFQMFSGLGLHWRVRLIRKLAQELATHGIPEDKEKLLELPGIGPYAASAFLSFHVGKRHAIIDSNVVRLYGRLFGFPIHGETRRNKQFIAVADWMTPERRFQKYNYALLDFTREICRVKPKCEACPLRMYCVFYRNLPT